MSFYLSAVLTSSGRNLQRCSQAVRTAIGLQGNKGTAMCRWDFFGDTVLLGSKQMNIVLAITPGSGCRGRGDPRLGPGGRRTLALNPATQSGRMDSSTSSRSNGWP